MNKQASIPTPGIITRLSLLALLSFKSMHGYELRKEIEDRRMDQWADVRYGSIYAGLRQLTEEGLLEKVSTERAGNRPPRTVYRTTEAGREEMLRLLRQAWLQPAFAANAIDVALSFFPLLPRDEVARLLEERLHTLDAMVGDLDATQDETARQHQARGIEPGIRAMVAALFDHRRRLLTAEREWTAHVLGLVRDGAFAVDEKVLERWRAQDAGA